MTERHEINTEQFAQRHTFASLGAEFTFPEPEVVNGVASNLYEARDRGRDVFKTAKDNLFNDGRVLVIGPAGAGKTLMVYQLAAAVFYESGRTKRPRIGLYDNILDDEKGMRRRNDGKGQLEGVQFNQNLHDVLLNVDIGEFPGVGFKEERDRGVTNLDKTMEEMRNDPDNKTLLIYITGNRVVQTAAGLLRRELIRPKVENVFEILDRHKVNLEGISRTDNNATAIIKMFAKMGQEEHISQINREIDSLMNIWIASRPREAIRYLNGLRPAPKVNIEDIGEIFRRAENYKSFTDELSYYKRMAESWEQKMLEEAAYMEAMFYRKNSMSIDQAVVVHNRYQTSKISFDVRPYVGQHS